MNSLRTTLKLLREKKGFTIEELSKLAKVGVGTIGDIERGKNRSTVKTINKLAIALKLTPEERNQLDSAFLGREVSKMTSVDISEMNKKNRLQFEDLMKENSMFFNDEKISDEDKEKLFESLQEAFFTVKILNKRKK